MRTLYWHQGGGCGGDTMSLLGADGPDLVETLKQLDVEILYHPSISAITAKEHRALLQSLLSGERPLDVFCVEGAVIRGPGGTGMYDTFEGKPKKELIAGLARRARFVLAAGTCAAYGGLGASGEVEATGMQFHRTEIGGFLGAEFRSGAGLPVVNMPGCPAHGDALAATLVSILQGAEVALDSWNAPTDHYGMLIHQGCSRNEYHEFRVEDDDFGQRGCLFFHLGCRGPLTHGPCNKLLWGRRNSKTRVGVACVGCTRPDFPQPHPFFETRNIAGIPIDLPEGVDRAHYLAYKEMAAAAAPVRLRERQTRL
jgi:uptake hydrogenase small subunit